MIRLAVRTPFRAFLVGALLLAVLTAPTSASNLQTDLKVYLDRLRALYPEAEVTGRFYDWRSLSIYRSHAGLHLGYDIALNAGRRVPAGWPGRVVDIIPWTDTEYGVCVEVAGGYRVTYGHLYPIVHIGDSVMAGQYVGSVAHDHVDIKVKDGSGGYLDWGGTYGVLAGGGWAPGAGGGLLPPPPGMGGPQAVVASGPDALLENYRQQAALAATRKLERDRARDLVRSLTAYIQRESAGLPAAESQMLAWYRAADEHKVSEAQVEALSLTVKARRSQVNRLTVVLEGRQGDLRELEAASRSAIASAAETREAALKAGVEATRLAEIDRAARKSATAQVSAPPNTDLEQRLADARQKVQFLRDRYAQGGASRGALDDAEKAYARLRVALALWQHGSKDAARDLNW
jgi:hypothetical protein